MSEKITPIKGFRTPPQPTKGQVLQENATLGEQLTQKLQAIQQFFGNLINQLMRQSKTHDQELAQICIWLSSFATAEAAQKGDHLLLDYLGLLLNEDGTDGKVTVPGADGGNVDLPDYFDGGNGKMFMLTNLVGGTLIPGFEEQLVGLKAGESKTIEVQFPKEYGVESLRSRKARFTVFIHDVRRAFPTSPVGEAIDENARIRSEIKARMAAEAAQARAAAEAAVKEAQAPKEDALAEAPAESGNESPAPEAAPATEAPSEAPQS